MDDEQEASPGVVKANMTPAAMRMLGRASRAMAQHRATNNPLFLWDAIQALTSPDLNGVPFILRQEIRDYLHAAATGITMAGLSPVENFKDGALKALQFSDSTNGSSVPKGFAKLESAANFLGIYLVLRDRHQSDRAQHMMAERIGLTQARIKALITESRSNLKLMMQANGEPIPADDALGNPAMKGTSDLMLLQFLEGLPMIIWVNRKRRRARKVT